jgi:hypothetical protein
MLFRQVLALRLKYVAPWPLRGERGALQSPKLHAVYCDKSVAAAILAKFAKLRVTPFRPGKVGRRMRERQR